MANGPADERWPRGQTLFDPGGIRSIRLLAGAERRATSGSLIRGAIGAPRSGAPTNDCTVSVYPHKTKRQMPDFLADSYEA